MELYKQNFSGIYAKQGKRFTSLYTENLVPGEVVYGERLVRDKGIEYREWDPKRSKLAAAILKGAALIGLGEGDTVLYLGSSTGTTVSHVSDIVGKNGFIYALDFAPRVMRDLIFVAEKRKNIAPILADANQPFKFMHMATTVDFLFQDVAQKKQAEIFLKNCELYLKEGGFAFLSVKSRSEDITKKPAQIYQDIRHKLEKEMIVVDFRVLDPFEKDHCAFVVKKK